MSYQLVDGLQTKAIPVAHSCSVLGVSRSSFYETRHYNCERLHSVLGNLPPSVSERDMAAEKPIAVSEIT